MRTFTAKTMNFLILSVLLPVVYGCNGGGGGGSASLGSLFAGGSPSGSSTGSSTGSTSGLVGSGGGDSLAAIHNPEPATMMLIGGGVAAMAYLRSRVR